MLKKFMQNIENVNPWHFLWIGIIFSELFTFIMSSILSFLWWGYISLDILLIGSIDAFVVALLVIIIVIYFVNMIKEKSIVNRLLSQEVKTLTGLLPICATCKKIRDDKGYWKQIESYIRDHSEAEFSHGICPDCHEKHKEEIVKFRSSRLSK